MEFRQFLERGIIDALADELIIAPDQVAGGVSVASNVLLGKGYKTVSYELVKLLPNNESPKYAKIRIIDTGGDSSFVVRDGNASRRSPELGKEFLITIDQLNQLQSQGLVPDAPPDVNPGLGGAGSLLPIGGD